LDTIGDLLRYVSEALNRLDLPYAVGGSVAAMAYGEPRFTRDLDVVVQLDPASVDRFLAAFPRPAFYVDPPLVRETARRGGTFNVIHPESGLKLDVFVPSDAIQRGQVANARPLRQAQGEVRISPPEELIVMKLRYYADSESERHLRDIASMLRISPDAIDRGRVAELAEGEGLLDLWQQVVERTDQQG
jgi:hypothetical protein